MFCCIYMNLILINFLSKLKNASLVQKNSLTIKYNKLFLPILKILYKEGFILSYIKLKENLLIRFRYYNNLNNLRNIKVVSTIAKPIYLNKFDILKISEKNKIFFFATSKGLLNSLDCKRLKLGGKFIFFC